MRKSFAFIWNGNLEKFEVAVDYSLTGLNFPTMRCEGTNLLLLNRSDGDILFRKGMSINFLKVALTQAKVCNPILFHFLTQKFSEFSPLNNL